MTLYQLYLVNDLQQKFDIIPHPYKIPVTSNSSITTALCSYMALWVWWNLQAGAKKLRELLDRLWAANLMLNPLTFEFFRPEIEYLVHTVSIEA